MLTIKNEHHITYGWDCPLLCYPGFACRWNEKEAARSGTQERIPNTLNTHPRCSICTTCRVKQLPYSPTNMCDTLCMGRVRRLLWGILRRLAGAPMGQTKPIRTNPLGHLGQSRSDVSGLSDCHRSWRCPREWTKPR